MTDDFIYAEPTAIADIPEPATNLGILILGAAGAATVLNRKKISAKQSAKAF